MEKIFKYLLLFLAAITLTTSCSNDDEPEINTEVPMQSGRQLNVILQQSSNG